MGADRCMVFNVFVLLLRSFLHKCVRNLKSVLKVFKRGMEGKDFFSFKNILLFSRAINTSLNL